MDEGMSPWPETVTNDTKAGPVVLCTIITSRAAIVSLGSEAVSDQNNDNVDNTYHCESETGKVLRQQENFMF